MEQPPRDPTATQAHRDEIKDAPRPTQIVTETSEIIGAVRVAKEIDDTFRVWIKRWNVARSHYNSSDAENWMREKYEGRLRTEDMMVLDRTLEKGTWDVMVHTWTILSEWNTQDRANIAAEEAARETITSDIRIELKVLARNSRAEYDLREYGSHKLPKGRTA